MAVFTVGKYYQHVFICQKKHQFVHCFGFLACRAESLNNFVSSQIRQLFQWHRNDNHVHYLTCQQQKVGEHNKSSNTKRARNFLQDFFFFFTWSIQAVLTGVNLLLLKFAQTRANKGVVPIYLRFGMQLHRIVHLFCNPSDHESLTWSNLMVARDE